MSALLTVSRRSSLEDGDSVAIEVRDASGATIVVELSLENYAEALLGLARVPCATETIALEKWGKTRVIESRKVVCPRLNSKNEYQDWLVVHAHEDGWELSNNLTSRDSIDYQADGTVILTYKVTKWV